MRIALATDAWFPQVNGVVRSIATTVAEMERRGHEIKLVTPQQFLTVPMPGYASIRLAIAPRFGLRRALGQWAPDLVHIATEGPIGWSARGWCLANQVPFTTAFHTRFPEYASVRTGISADRFWPIMRRFHAPSRAVLVSTESFAGELAARGIGHTRRWSRGIDHGLFKPEGARHLAMTALPGPVLLYVGRVAPEKNLEAFLSLDRPGTKVVVGDGPAREALERQFPQARFLGALSGEELASAYRAADCFVFPSLTDTFGLVVIEALACGVPVAGYPVTGPIDILGADGRGPDGLLAEPAGALDDDLGKALDAALAMSRADAASLGASFSWTAATDQFEAVLAETLDNHRGAARLLAA
jgi:glycosyltransferase involved in cell wall biosynthesis